MLPPISVTEEGAIPVTEESVIPITSKNVKDYAWLFDLDGTLAPIVDRPEAAQVPSETQEILQKIYAVTNKAIAIVSGRTLVQIDQLLDPFKFCAVGLHGAEWRDPNGHVDQLEVNRQSIAEMEKKLKKFVQTLLDKPAATPDAGSADTQGLASAQDFEAIQDFEVIQNLTGVRLENKGRALAVHYRDARQHAYAITQAMKAVQAPYATSFALQPGKMVSEIKPIHANKGEGIKRLMQFSPFCARIPFFVGDDLTDEAGFESVNQLGGISLKIGEGDTQAKYRMRTPNDLARWLTYLFK